MRRVVVLSVLALATVGVGCHDSSGNGGNSVGRGGASGTSGGAGAGGTAGTSGGAGAGGTAGTSGGAGAGGTAGTSGGAGAGGTAGTSGAAGACGEPASCEGYDNTPDAGLTAVVSCLFPSVVPASSPVTVAIYGHHLAIAAGSPAIVTLDNGTPLNGVPATACHLDVQVPANQLSTPRTASVVVSPGGWIRDSAPASLTIR